MLLNLKLFRLITFAISVVFGIIMLGLNAHEINVVSGSLFYYDFSALAVASGVLTMISLPAMYVIDIKRKGAFTSWVAFEYTWLTLLWVLWLAVAARTTQGYLILFNTGDCNYRNPIVATMCSEFATTMALGYSLWILLMGYTATILTFAIIGHNRGNQGIWKAPVTELMNYQATNAEKGSPVLATPAQPYPPASGSPGHLPHQPYPNQYPSPYQQPQYQQPQAQYQQPQPPYQQTYPNSQYGGSPQPQHSGYPQAQV